jgi:hypothetical protein
MPYLLEGNLFDSHRLDECLSICGKRKMATGHIVSRICCDCMLFGLFVGGELHFC